MLETTEEKIIIICTAIIIIGILIFAGLRPLYEAQVFNKCTGSHASYFDALFTELRVLECKN
jgi:hypothetical protein